MNLQAFVVLSRLLFLNNRCGYVYDSCAKADSINALHMYLKYFECSQTDLNMHSKQEQFPNK